MQHVPLHGTASARAAAAAIDAFHIGGGEEPSRRRGRDQTLAQQQRSATARRRMSLDNSALDFGQSDGYCLDPHAPSFLTLTSFCSAALVHLLQAVFQSPAHVAFACL